MGMYWPQYNTNPLELMIINGTMGIQSGNDIDCGGNRWPTSNVDQVGFNYQLYDIGWSFVWYSSSATQWSFINFKNFKTPALTSSINLYSFKTENKIMIGGSLGSSATIESSFRGIIHSVRIRSTTMTQFEIMSEWLIPTIPEASQWDYFISMFEDLGVNYNVNAQTMYGYNGYDIRLTSSYPFSSDVTSGLQLKAGEIVNVDFVRIWLFIFSFNHSSNYFLLDLFRFIFLLLLNLRKRITV